MKEISKDKPPQSQAFAEIVQRFGKDVLLWLNPDQSIPENPPTKPDQPPATAPEKK